ncbi:hypothetical protein NQ318_020359 [Aromia moschata]|uniref:Uncharacterized protein n=1 Tax=Aromia moschata TaxID=1265417 RepID=A0AAV8XHX9_9CUCU|nr:hypothetical protein NQ318_020359 [Aromia moschata]
MSSEFQSFNIVNDADLKKLTENIIRIDKPQNLGRLHFRNITVSNLYTPRLNEHYMKDYMLNLEKLYTADKINNLKVNGSVMLKSVQNVSTINNIAVDDLLNNTLQVSPFRGSNIGSGVFRPLESKQSCHSIYKRCKFEKIDQETLRKRTDQTISAPYSFTKIKAKNIVTPKINNISFEHIIDVSSEEPQTIYASHGIQFTSAKVLQSLRGDETSPCDIKTFLSNLKNPPTQNWYTMAVRGNVTFLDTDNVLSRIFEKAIVNNSNNVVHAPVIFSSNILTTNVFSRKYINDVNIKEIIDDAVMDTEEKQSSKIGNTDPDKIVSLQSPRKIPSATFESLEVLNNLNVTHINHMPFQDVLQKRLLINNVDEQITNGVYFFDNIKIENMETPSLNNISMDDVVFDVGRQEIFSAKRFLKPVEVYGNLKSDYINGVNLTNIHEKSALTGATLTMSGSITILRPSVLKGSIEVETINGYPIANIKEILYKGVTKSEANKIHHMKDGVTRVVNKYLRGAQAMPSEYMYLEKSDVLQISVSNAISARAVTIKGYALIHVTGVESGEYCGLPSSCKCPVQYSIEVSPEHSIAVYPNKGFQRIFTYDDENMIIHFITNSVSSESTCRTDTARVLNEISMMSWNRLPTENSTGTFYQYDKVIEGYISGAEFFTLNGRSYAVIGRYYDANIDSHDLKCLVIRFSDDKSKAEEIQRIPSKGAWSIYLFHTAQGVTLVIGNTGSTLSHFDEKTSTTIYRFNEEEQQFKELRTIPSYGSLMATGVVLDADSLIVLAHKNAPLQILKYNHHFENYYLYQSFELDSHIEGISVFYTGGFGISDAYLCIVTGNERPLNPPIIVSQSRFYTRIITTATYRVGYKIRFTPIHLVYSERGSGVM